MHEKKLLLADYARPKSALEIVAAYLVLNGYDGLYNDDGECGCTVGDLSPGMCLSEHCLPGYAHPLGNGVDFLVCGSKTLTDYEKECMGISEDKDDVVKDGCERRG